ncbi:DUF389 domain-containing protein [Kitasatospora phosalacinea]|uniref:Membrane protein n=1 Tax=Kitasatospora phosalacinea TaxID=2065 RepID=A0A9W6PIX5_9ACTN|nr:DUF389 domain-containing protein [Kitasatospora phosalacinea]GLW55728.1 membrane protein [Kitasatospora phosalacinea]
MISSVREWVLPERQRRSVEELRADLDLSAGEVRAKRSAFWTMLVLSSVIAACGVLTDSTATVIGAMIIAPLSTPIMGIALGAVRRRIGGAGWFVLGGVALVVAVGALASLVVPSGYDLLADSQIAGRTSPGLLDLAAALATGFAGAVALARRDVAAVLPGVAIAISLVPPLVVVGVCAGQGAWWLALGALVLFVSNLLALVFAGMVVFAAIGAGAADRGPRRAYATLGVLFAAVGLLLAASTTGTVLVHVWTNRTSDAATAWLAATPGAQVVDVRAQSRTLHVAVRTPAELPPVADLLDALRGRVPDGVPVVVTTTEGRRIEAGRVGAGQ